MTSTTFATLAGVDVAIDVTPDTPAVWQRLSTIVTALDRLASAAAILGPDWQVDVRLDTTTTIRAIPATVTTGASA